MAFRLIQADCIEAMAAMDEASIDAIVTDPPYGLEFMGKEWDRLQASKLDALIGRHPDAEGKSVSPFYRPGWGNSETKASTQESQAWHHAWAIQALRVLKPGGHLLAFGGTRTYHRLACALEDAGFEIRDCLAWLYGSGFPKSLDVSKAIDKANDAEREVIGGKPGNVCDGNPCRCSTDGRSYSPTVHSPATTPATPEAQRWQGWGTALKPAFEPIVLARKPLIGSVAANVQEFGTGALNVDGTRIETSDELENHGRKPTENGWDPRMSGGQEQGQSLGQAIGRWPANVILDEEVSSELGPQARYFYSPKTDRAERNRGLEHYERRSRTVQIQQSEGQQNAGIAESFPTANHHPTVKPVALMQWLCRLITPPKGTVLDPFTGSGSTGIAALREGFEFIGIEREAEYVEIARDRILGDAPLWNEEAADVQDIHPTDVEWGP